MFLRSKISNFLRSLFGLEKDVDRIMKPFVKVSNELQTYAERQVVKADKDVDFARKLQEQATLRQEQAERARRLASGVGGLL